MEQSIAQQIEQCAQKTNTGAVTFPELLGELIKLDVEAYFADYRKSTTTYYNKKNQAYTTNMPKLDLDISQTFNATALQEAIQASQRDEIRYPEFKKRSRAAGCVGYFVWIKGRQVTYFGRQGELHIEKFQDK